MDENENKGSIGSIRLPQITEEQLYKIADFKNKERGLMKINYVNSEGSYYSHSLRFMPPPIDFHKMAELPNLAPALDVSIDAMETNVTGFGWELDPTVDIKEIVGEDGQKQILNARTNEPVSEDQLKAITDEQVEIAKLFSSSSIEDPEGLLGVFKKKTRDLETIGNAWIEISRDDDGRISGIHHLPGWTMRLMKSDKEKTPITIQIQNPVTLDYFDLDTFVKFRRHVQVNGTKRKFFKSFGDPRRLNALTGEYLNEGDAEPVPFESANEVIHFRLYHPLYEYGLPRWISATPSILSARASQIINHRLLSNNGIPMGLVIVEGYQSDKLEEKIKEEINFALRGEDSFHSLLVLQVESKIKGAAGPAGRAIKPSVRIEKLSDLVTQEGMFMEFAKAVDETIIGTFRLPNLLVGRNNDINRSTAEVAIQVVEEQVFAPERTAHDFIINSKILADMGIRYWKYRTKTARLENIEKRAEIAARLVSAGIVLPREARGVAGEILQRKLSDIDEPWMDMPEKIYLQQHEADGNATLESEGDDEVVMKLSDEDREDIAVKMVTRLVKWREDLNVKATHLIKRVNNVS